jgi:hypothetical protein
VLRATAWTKSWGQSLDHQPRPTGSQTFRRWNAPSATRPSPGTSDVTTADVAVMLCATTISPSVSLSTRTPDIILVVSIARLAMAAIQNGRSSRGFDTLAPAALLAHRRAHKALPSRLLPSLTNPDPPMRPVSAAWRAQRAWCGAHSELPPSNIVPSTQLLGTASVIMVDADLTSL